MCGERNRPLSRVSPCGAEVKNVKRNSFLFLLEKKLDMHTLGINAAFHDSSACVIKDGQLLAAAEEERFTHVKHGKRPIPFSTYELPFHAIDYCLGVAGIHINDVDHFAYSFDP